MSPWLLLLLAVPLAIGVSVSQSILSFVEDLEAAADPDRTGGEGRVDDPDDDDPVVVAVPDPTYDLLSLVSSTPLAGADTSAGEEEMAGGAALDLLLSSEDAEQESTLWSDLDTDSEIELPTDQPVDFTAGEDQLTIYLTEGQTGAAQSMLPKLMFDYDGAQDRTTLSAGDHPLTTLTGDQRGLSVAFYEAGNGPLWQDSRGEELSSEDGEAADIILALITMKEMSQAA